MCNICNIYTQRPDAGEHLYLPGELAFHMPGVPRYSVHVWAGHVGIFLHSMNCSFARVKDQDPRRVVRIWALGTSEALMPCLGRLGLEKEQQIKEKHCNGQSTLSSFHTLCQSARVRPVTSRQGASIQSGKPPMLQQWPKHSWKVQFLGDPGRANAMFV